MKFVLDANIIVATAVSEKLAAMNTASYFQTRRERADFDAFDRIMARRGGEPPGDGDQLDQVGHYDPHPHRTFGAQPV